MAEEPEADKKVPEDADDDGESDAGGMHAMFIMTCIVIFPLSPGQISTLDVSNVKAFVLRTIPRSQNQPSSLVFLPCLIRSNLLTASSMLHQKIAIGIPKALAFICMMVNMVYEVSDSSFSRCYTHRILTNFCSLGGGERRTSK